MKRLTQSLSEDEEYLNSEAEKLESTLWTAIQSLIQAADSPASVVIKEDLTAYKEAKNKEVKDHKESVNWTEENEKLANAIVEEAKEEINLLLK